ncbi:MAG: 4-hydroxy-3-methylbut-2-enyl diphosphate reductase [Chlamydiota bacterium]
MKLLIASPRGFCAGVERAIHTVEKTLELYRPPVYVKHEIVHNKHVISYLEEKGARFIEDLSLVPEGSVIIYSAHGVSPQVRQEAKDRRLTEIDATCGLVTKVHSAAKRWAKRGYKIILIGHKDHVEVIGTAGEAPEATHIVENPSDVDRLTFSPSDPLFYLTQTTLSVLDVEQIVQKLVEKYPQIETLPSSSICYATTNRQVALRQFAKTTDLFLVVGDSTSSNSNRLCEIAKSEGPNAYLINDEQEIDPDWLQSCQVIGMSAGASTPETVVQKCIERLQELGVTSIEEVLHKKEEVVFDLPKNLRSALEKKAASSEAS